MTIIEHYYGYITVSVWFRLRSTYSGNKGNQSNEEKMNVRVSKESTTI
jgi:hypothetical protein